MNNDKFRCWLSEHRDLTTETLKRFKVGLLKEDNGIYRTTFPVFDRQGNLTNIRKHLFGYKPELTDQRRKEMRKTLPWGAGLRADLFPMSALERTEEILIVEGEADAALANQLGFSAVTGTLGAGNWRPEWAIHLRGMKKVIILYDLDEAGQIGAQKVAASLSSVVPDVRIAKYPFAQQGGRS
ncbi:MAG: toprim domain-containing protein [Janthinobacterium lividum]